MGCVVKTPLVTIYKGLTESMSLYIIESPCMTESTTLRVILQKMMSKLLQHSDLVTFLYNLELVPKL